MKDGSKGRSKHDGPDEDDELHVHVDGPTMEMVRVSVACYSNYNSITGICFVVCDYNADELIVYFFNRFICDQVDKACKLIEELLVVVDDDKNEHKQKQLRELALINGTLKEDEYCSVCAEKGHR